MFNWLKPKKPVKDTPPPAQKPDREALVAQAMKSAQSAREAIGEENLKKLAELIRRKQEADVSPADQAKKIIAQMDKGRVSDFLKFVMQEDQTKH